jgi:hypothetical protein
MHIGNTTEAKRLLDRAKRASVAERESSWRDRMEWRSMRINIYRAYSAFFQK